MWSTVQAAILDEGAEFSFSNVIENTEITIKTIHLKSLHPQVACKPTLVPGWIERELDQIEDVPITPDPTVEFGTIDFIPLPTGVIMIVIVVICAGLFLKYRIRELRWNGLWYRDLPL
jgi:hypothetical protein